MCPAWPGPSLFFGLPDSSGEWVVSRRLGQAKMQRMRWLLVSIVPCALLVGCVSMTPDDCRFADWYQRGLSDGRDGRSDDRIDDHRRACAKAGIGVDVELWRRGWGEGVRSFCVPRVAWQQGLNNRSYSGACRHLDDAEWRRWYRLGQDAYNTKSERDARQREIDKLEDQLKKSQKDDERKSLREKIKQLDQERARLRRLLEQQMRAEPR